MLLTQAKTDNEIILLWLHGKATLTQKNYLSDIQQFMSFVGKSIAECQYEDFIQYLNFLSFKGYKDSTKRIKMTAVKSLFSFCNKVGYLQVNIPQMVPNIKNNDSVKMKAISQDLIIQIISNTKTKRDELMLKCLYLLGLRVSELINICWDDFNQINGGTELRVIGKGNKERFILVPQFLYQELLSIKEHDQYVFVSSQSGDRLCRQSVNKILRTISKKLGIKSINPHAFRHSHATHSLANGCDLSLLQQSLGHSSISTTQQYLSLRHGEGSSSYLDI